MVVDRQEIGKVTKKLAAALNSTGLNGRASLQSIFLESLDGDRKTYAAQYTMTVILPSDVKPYSEGFCFEARY
jgi:hypothetical protein